MGRMMLAILTMLLAGVPEWGWSAVREYHLLVEQREITIEGLTTRGMTINSKIPGPVLSFKQGDEAVIHVENRMNVPTSMHWHGLLVPPNMDGVPFMTQLPIAPGETFTYRFPIRQTGTYWYHSHSGLQEQRGLYGSIVIDDDLSGAQRDQVVLLSDWTTDDPNSVMRTLKRGSEWFALQKGSSQSILGALRSGRAGDYFYRELQRMPPMDIADVAYDYFLANGSPQTSIPAGQGETVRLRVINGSATTYFHLDYAGGPMTIISADGQPVRPVERDLFLIGVAETYDLLLKVPGPGRYEFRATAHDGSGYSSTWIGSGEKHRAKDIPKPDLYEPMDHGDVVSLFSLTPAGVMGMGDDRVEAGDFDRPGMGHEGHGMSHGDMQEHGKMSMDHGEKSVEHPHSKSTLAPDELHDHSSGNRAPAAQPHGMAHDEKQGVRQDGGQGKMGGHGHGNMGMKHHSGMDMKMDHGHTGMVMAEPMKKHPKEAETELAGKPSARSFGYDYGFMAADISSRTGVAVEGGEQRPGTPYALLQATRSTGFKQSAPVREIRLTLDGDMRRYTWFLDNKPMTESDTILVRSDEITRFILINRTMMHHPMHLHGHFFRVINGQGDHAPLKHTVDVAPMSTTVIEFFTDEPGDWFFHCHLLYHMMAGMARMVHYQGFQPGEDVLAERRYLAHDHWAGYGRAEIQTNMSEGMLTLAGSRWSYNGSWEAGWQDVDETEWEGLMLGQYHVNSFYSLFGGVDLHGEGSASEEARGVAGIGYTLPFNIESRNWLDTEWGVRISLEKEFELTPRIGLHCEAEYDSHEYWESKLELSYLVDKYFSLLANYHTEFGYGVGLEVRF